MDGRHHRRPRVLAEGERQPVEVVVHQVELARPGQCVRDVQRLPDPAVQLGILRVAVRADAVESGRRHRVERGEERDIDSSRDQPLGQQAGDRLPRPVVPGRRAPGDRREHGELHVVILPELLLPLATCGNARIGQRGGAGRFGSPCQGQLMGDLQPPNERNCSCISASGPSSLSSSSLSSSWPCAGSGPHWRERSAARVQDGRGVRPAADLRSEEPSWVSGPRTPARPRGVRAAGRERPPASARRARSRDQAWPKGKASPVRR